MTILLSGQEQRAQITPDVVSRFWARVDVGHPLGCWVWTGCLDRSRGEYGVLRVNGPQVRAHRFAYHLLRGPIPDGLVLDHVCRNTHCVNPDHLEPVTSVENVRRAFGAGRKPMRAARSRPTHCRHGHEYTAPNTLIRRDGRRQCRTCHRDQQRARWHAKKLSGSRDMASPTGTRPGARAGHLGAAGAQGEGASAAPPLEGGQREHRDTPMQADSR